jgi:ABC-type multidrug transport system fused ATPase/permease subunit
VDEIIRESENKAENIQKHGQKFTDIHHELRLENVTYSYNDGESEALKGLSLVIGSREYVAIIGKSGCGKSTTLDILIGLIKPASGKVTIDGIDLNEIDRSTYLQKIGFVSQESIFFIGTIRENICIGLGDSCDEMYLWECLKMAQIDEFVRSLPNTIETEIGEAGVKLSGGQKQRLAIARALMRRPALLILDEATSALDSDSEVRFQMAIQAVAHNYTIVVVAHRLSTIRNAQRIYVLDGGKLVQQGDYDSLTARRGIFLELVDAQALGVN